MLPSNKLQIKICAKCFLCHSIVLYENCSKCHECCLKSTCRDQTSNLLANLAESGRRSESSSNPQRGLHPLLSDPAQTKKIPHHPNFTPTRGGVTSVDFKDAYFHIPIQEQSRKYLRFHVEGQTYQFKALPFGLSTAPMEFTVVAKEVKLMAIHKGIRIHQYLDDWLVRATSHQDCLQHTQVLVQICHHLGWLVNLEKSELEPKQVFDFVRYQFDLQSGLV